jgi:hypothetical protein
MEGWERAFCETLLPSSGLPVNDKSIESPKDQGEVAQICNPS